ncbi:MAG TPA: DNA gyrase modulator, partial [Gemmatimonadaceae bacterium]
MSRPGFNGSPKSLLDNAAKYMPEGAVMTREKSQALIEKIVKMSKADSIDVSVDSGYQSNIRFAANQMSTAGGVTNTQIGIQSTFGNKHGVATTNDLSDDALRRAVERAETLAKLSPDDPENMPELPPQTYLPVNGYFDSTANLSPEDRARAALTAL